MWFSFGGGGGSPSVGAIRSTLEGRGVGVGVGTEVVAGVTAGVDGFGVGVGEGIGVVVWLLRLGRESAV